MRTFVLYRKQDETGISGTGYIAKGIQLDSGRAVMEWTVAPFTLSIHQSINDIIQVHGHGGKTMLLWEDELSERLLNREVQEKTDLIQKE